MIRRKKSTDVKNVELKLQTTWGVKMWIMGKLVNGLHGMLPLMFQFGQSKVNIHQVGSVGG